MPATPDHTTPLPVALDVFRSPAETPACGAPRAADLLRAVVEGTTDAVFVKDRAGKYLLFNEAAARFVGRPVAEVLGRDDTELFDPESARRVMARDRQIMESGLTETAEEELTAAGVTRTYQATKAPYRDAAGHVVGLIGVSREVTAFKRAQAERDRAEQARRESEARFHAVWEHARDAMRLLDEDGVIVAVNAAFCHLFGMPRGELEGRPFTVTYAGDRDPAALLRQYRERVHSRRVDPRTERRMVLRDGRTVDLEMTSTFIEQPGGPPLLLGLFRDITEQKRLEEQYRQSQKMEAVGRLAGGIAHDFNNLLTVINGYADLLVSSAAPDDPGHAPLVQIRSAGERAAALTAQLLAFSRKAIIEPKVIELNDLASRSAGMLGRLIGEDVTLVTVLAPGLPRVKVDPAQIEQVVLNLAVNARDAMPTGGRLTLETRPVLVADGDAAYPNVAPGRYVRLSVSDTGVGMSAAVKARIFEPFFTTKEAGKGTGLGLAMVYGIVRTHGGHVGVESQPGAGTTFEILLPAVAVGSAGPPPSGERHAPAGTETVLLVEDEAAVLGIARIALRRQGYTVLEANGGAAALRVAEAHAGPIHLLVTDVVMPGMGGREVAEALRDRRAGLKTLYVSGYTDDAVVRHGIVEATDAFLQKPYTPLTLAQKVRSVLDENG